MSPQALPPHWHELGDTLDAYATEADAGTASDALRDVAHLAHWRADVLEATAAVLAGHHAHDPGPQPTPTIAWADTTQLVAQMAERAAYAVLHHRRALHDHTRLPQDARRKLAIRQIEALRTKAATMHRNLNAALELAHSATRPI